MVKNLGNISCEYCKIRPDSIFKSLNRKESGNLDLNKKCSIYNRGQVIFSEGSYPAGLYCINDGKIKLYKTGTEGKEQIVRLHKSGDILGYRALISGKSYSTSATTLEDSRICFIPRDFIFNIIRDNVNFSLSIIKLLTQDLEEAENRLLNLAQKPVRERLAEAILILKETYGTEKGDNSPLNVNLSREDLANIVGTATETVIRLLSDFKSEKLIATKGRKIEILNYNLLLKTSNIAD